MHVAAIFIKTCAGLALAHAALTPAAAAPYLPADGAQVLENLPPRSSAEQRELRQLRAALAAAPGRLAAASELARLQIRMARTSGDPRYLGYAQAALAPWWSQENPPLEVRLLRASVLQTQHRFPEALADLDAVVRADPRNAQAWLTRATILQVQGEYEAARKSCARMYGVSSALAVTTCIANGDAMTARAAQSYDRMKAVLAREPDAAPAVKTWTLTLMAEIAARLGDPAAADGHFREALSGAPDDSYLLGAYADFLLDSGRTHDAVELLAAHTRADGLLLRYAIAIRRAGSSGLARHVDALQARFDAAQLRADPSHKREQAMFELHLRNDPRAALELARDNWAEQKEFADARILLEAAAAAQDQSAAAPVIGWLRRTGLQTAVLDRLTAALEGKP